MPAENTAMSFISQTSKNHNGIVANTNTQNATILVDHDKDKTNGSAINCSLRRSIVMSQYFDY